MITTDMSANIVTKLLKQGWTVERVAETLDSPLAFVAGVRAKKHVLTLRDVRKLAKRVGETPQLMLLNSADPRPGMEPLFDVIRHALEVSAGVRTPTRSKTGSKKRRTGSRAA